MRKYIHHIMIFIIGFAIGHLITKSKMIDESHNLNLEVIQLKDEVNHLNYEFENCIRYYKAIEETFFEFEGS